MVAKIHGKRAVMEYYQMGDVAKGYQKLRAGNLFRQIRTELHSEMISSLLAGRKVARLLDAGIGTGRIARKLRNFKKAVGIDSSKPMLREARKHLGAKWKLRHCDVFHMPFKGGEFDAVVSTRFIWHFKKSERGGLFSELKRVMEPGAVLVIDVPNKDVKRYGFKKTGLKGCIFTSSYTPQGIARELRSYGFRGVEVHPTMHLFWVTKWVSGRKWGEKLKGLLYLLSKLPIGKPYGYIVVGKKP